VPNLLSINTIQICSKFRAKERIPVLTYAFKFYAGDQGKKISFLYRSSQSKPGMT